MQTEDKMGSEQIYRIVKRVQDVVLSLTALIILLPLLAILSLVIVIDSPGASPLYFQERVGINGKRFKFIKLRTMVPDADKMLAEVMSKNEMDGPVFKIKNDPRITRIGKFLRKCSVDELPQLWNVIVGDMSLVGPRPALVREVEQYDEYTAKRLTVLPGLSCYWQIQPHRNDLSFKEWLELDLKYIRERSLLTDWKIIILTFRAVLGLQGE